MSYTRIARSIFFWCIALPSCPAQSFDINGQMLQELKALRQEVQQLRDEIRELKGAKQPLQSSVPRQDPSPPAPPPTPPPAPQSGRPAAPVTYTNLSIGAAYAERGSVAYNGRGRFFRQFGVAGLNAAFQLDGEMQYYRQRREGQGDLGLLVRLRRLGVGGFASVRHARLSDLHAGGTLAQSSVLVDYFPRFGGRIGAFASKGFVTEANLRTIGSRELYLQVVDQAGLNAQFPLGAGPRRPVLELTAAGLLRRDGDRARVVDPYRFFESVSATSATDAKRSLPIGGAVRLIKPITASSVAVFVEYAYNDSLLLPQNSWSIRGGLRFGTVPLASLNAGTPYPVPMDPPRIRYEMLTRENNSGLPSANAGRDQIGIPPGPVRLDGSASQNAVRFSWVAVAPTDFRIQNADQAQPSFEAAPDTVYILRLTVFNAGGLSSSAQVKVVTTAEPRPTIGFFVAEPSNVRAGERVVLRWDTSNAAKVSVVANPVGSTAVPLGEFRSIDSTVVSPQTTTIYELTARSNSGVTATARATVNVNFAPPAIQSFTAEPSSIAAGQSSRLSWSVPIATSVLLDGAPQALTGSQIVKPDRTTTYRLTVINGDQRNEATVTVTVRPLPLPAIQFFTADRTRIGSGEQSRLSWRVQGSSDVNISSIGPVEQSGQRTVSPTVTTAYVLTARNASGESTAKVTVEVANPAITLFEAVPQMPIAGEPFRLQWTTVNATDVSITGVGKVAPSGTHQLTIIRDTEFTIVAGSGGIPVTKTILVKVIFKPPFGSKGNLP